MQREANCFLSNLGEVFFAIVTSYSSVIMVEILNETRFRYEGIEHNHYRPTQNSLGFLYEPVLIESENK